ncbi:MAG: STAS domain-containing protein [Bacteroidales bacterium]|jgi:anti-anti-sigma factor|nr:STAS domain-containing protein [Bacteroidales bacterium]
MISSYKQDRIEIISINSDRIDALTAENLKNEIVRVTDKTHPMAVLNLQGVHYIDSTGFGCLLAVHKAARDNYGVLKFACPETKVSESFRILNLNTVFEIFESLDDCIRSFSS